MSQYKFPPGNRFLSYKDLLEHIESMPPDEISGPILCQVDIEFGDAFPISKIVNVEDNRIELETCSINSSQLKWKTWRDIANYIKDMKVYMLDFWVYISTDRSNYRVSDIVKNRYPSGAFSSGMMNYNILVIDYDEFQDD